MTTTTRLFTDLLRDAARPIWEKQFQHPFLTALGDGSLPRETFEFYIRQDALYLDELAKTFGFAATKTNDHAEMEHFGEALLRTLRVEQGLHQTYGARFGVSVAEMMATPMTPTTYAYTRHLLHIAATGSLAALITSVLPCAWIYAEVGRHFTRLLGGAPGDDHPYAQWLGTYASDEFEEVGAWLRARLNERAARMSEPGLAALEAIFVRSSQFEYMFWDMAWRRESWPV